MNLTYSSYLKLDTLLKLQEPLSEGEHDEMLFIIIHQVHELWFKLILHELEKLCGDFRDNELFEAIATFKRIRMILKTIVGQVDILETMTPMSFNDFRDRLDASSGVQSVQFREMEFTLGYKRSSVLKRFENHPEAMAVLKRRLEEPTLHDAFYAFLIRRGVEVPLSLQQRDLTLPTEPNEEVQKGILDLYTKQDEITILFELMTDFDEGFQEWRYRHIKLVERTLGNKPGTGGSAGAEYLKQSLWKPLFPDLWAIRSEL